MAILKVGGTQIASSSGSDVTLDNVALGGSVVFPAGHVVSIEHKNGPNVGSESTTADFSYLADKEITYTVKNANTKIFIMWDVYAQLTGATSEYAYTFQIRHSLDSYAAALVGDGIGQNIMHLHYTASGLAYTQMQVPVRALHTHNQSVDTVITYRIYCKCHNGTRALYSWDAWAETEIGENVYFMEITV